MMQWYFQLQHHCQHCNTPLVRVAVLTAFAWVDVEDVVVDAAWSWWLGLLVGSVLDLVEVLLKEGRVWGRRKKKVLVVAEYVLWGSGAEVEMVGRDLGLYGAWFLRGSPLALILSLIHISEPTRP
eukprot:1607206-Ditylum_brightwellii.AAC.1